MATARIEVAIASIPEKKESLRRALEALRNHLSASSPSPFSVPEWKDLDDHISSVESSIRLRLQALLAKEAAQPSSSPSDSKEKPSNEWQPHANPEPEVVPRPQLISLCINMDSKDLVSFIAQNRKDLGAIRSELNPALRSAPDPAKLVLDAMDGFFSSPPPTPKGDKKGDKDADALATRRTCINLLERIPVIGPEIGPSVRDQAKKLAAEWKGKVTDGGRENGLEAMGLLQLLVSYGLASEFKVDELLDLLILVSRRKQAVDLCKSLGLTENVPELGALRSVIKAIEEYKLESQYPREFLEKQVAKLEKRKEVKRRNVAAAAAASNSRIQKQQHPNKRPRPSATTSNAITGQTLPPGMAKQPQFGLADPSPHMGLAGAYGFASSGSLYNNASISGFRSPPRAYLYPSESLAGTASPKSNDQDWIVGPIDHRPSHGRSLHPPSDSLTSPSDVARRTLTLTHSTWSTACPSLSNPPTLVPPGHVSHEH
ncbi:hypothetical protein B296_00049804 [Ensete ventricosum]|uniref:FRIGIDA-like protein n=1 Tax=Ensete ventricosum TaxID=4639 RepID=A0A426YEI0_ENSVE|nr:hypothetical protein B296_00049804 [Ensete ventricosum]